MSSYGPPTEDTAIFDTIYFKQGEEFLTQNQADRRYLRFPNAQGTENLATITVSGTASFSQPITLTSTTASDRSINNTYYTLIDAVSNLQTGVIYSSGTNFIYDTNYNSAGHYFYSNTSGGVQTNPLKVTSDLTTITAGSSVVNVTTNDLFLNPVGSIDCNGKTLNMTSGEIHNCPLVHSQNNNDIIIEGKGTGDVILKTNGINRLTIDDTGYQTFEGGMSYDNATNTLATTLDGNVVLDEFLSAGPYYPVLASSNGSQRLGVNLAPVAMTYNCATDTLTCANFNGTIANATNATTASNANNVLVTTDNTSGTYYIPFTKTSGTGNKGLFQDDTTGPLSYNPSTATLSYNYWDVANPFIFDDFVSYGVGSAPFGWFNSVTTLGATRAVYDAVLDTGQGTKLTSRLGLLSLATGANNTSDNVTITGNKIVRPIQVKSITWGWVDCGTGTLASFTTPSPTNVTKSIGLSTTSTPSADDSDANAILWRRSSANSTTQNWQFYVNNVAVTNGTGPDTAVCNNCRTTIEFQFTGTNYQTRGIFVNLNNGNIFTSDWVNIPLNPTVGTDGYFIFHHLRNSGDALPRVLGIDYCLLQNASRAINRGTDNTITR